MELRYRTATLADVNLLAAMNQHLIEDEGNYNHMTLPQLQARMQRWLQQEIYTGVIFERDGKTAAYALYRLQHPIYLRHFLVQRDFRRQGVGRAAIDLLRREILAGHEIVLEVLVSNWRGRVFWESVGGIPRPTTSGYAMTVILPAVDQA